MSDTKIYTQPQAAHLEELFLHEDGSTGICFQLVLGARAWVASGGTMGTYWSDEDWKLPTKSGQILSLGPVRESDHKSELLLDGEPTGCWTRITNAESIHTFDEDWESGAKYLGIPVPPRPTQCYRYCSGIQKVVEGGYKCPVCGDFESFEDRTNGTKMKQPMFF